MHQIAVIWKLSRIAKSGLSASMRRRMEKRRKPSDALQLLFAASFSFPPCTYLSMLLIDNIVSLALFSIKPHSLKRFYCIKSHENFYLFCGFTHISLLATETSLFSRTLWSVENALMYPILIRSSIYIKSFNPTLSLRYKEFSHTTYWLF